MFSACDFSVRCDVSVRKSFVKLVPIPNAPRYASVTNGRQAGSLVVHNQNQRRDNAYLVRSPSQDSGRQSTRCSLWYDRFRAVRRIPSLWGRRQMDHPSLGVDHSNVLRGPCRVKAPNPERNLRCEMPIDWETCLEECFGRECIR
jgi:hypothetical protein